MELVVLVILLLEILETNDQVSVLPEVGLVLDLTRTLLLQ